MDVEIVERPVKTVESEPTPDFLEEATSGGSQLDEFLAELNLSRKHIFYGIGCFVLIIVLIFVGIFGFNYYKNSKRTPTQTEEPAAPSPEPQKTENTGVSSATNLGQPANLNPTEIGDSGVESSISIGSDIQGSTDIANYILTFRRLKNAYETDINGLLNQSLDRRARLLAHLTLLKSLYEESTQVSQKINVQLDALRQNYEEKSGDQKALDSNFFDQLNNFNGGTAEEILDNFINVGKEMIYLKTRFKALQKILGFYDQALPKLKNRIQDMELNSEILINGLKIYDVKGSDIKLIIPVTGEQVTSGGGLIDSPTGSSGGASGMPSFPINPADVKLQSGQDFVSQPPSGWKQ